jgi:trehalose transport system permease protein
VKTNPALRYAGVAVFTVALLFPIYILFLVAFVPDQLTLLSFYPSLLPTKLTLTYIQSALMDPAIVGAFDKSLVVAFLVAFFSLGLGIPAAYGLSRLSPRIAYGITTTLFVVNMMPAITIAIPISATLISWGLFDSDLGLALAQELTAIPLVTFLLVGAFQAIPRELEFQARVDGAGFFGTLFGVLVPLAKSSVIAAFLLAWLLSWDEFTFAVILAPIHPTLPIVIFDFVNGRGNLIAAAAFSFLVSVPVIILTVALQRYLKGEALAGGLKG